FQLKKALSGTYGTKPFYAFIGLNYLGFCGGILIGVGAGVAGVAAPLLTFSLIFCCSGVILFFAVPPPLTDTLIASDSTISEIANTQVPFSRKSPVFCTPINCDWLEKFDVKPPP